MGRLTDKNRETYAEHASLESIQVKLQAEQTERLRVERRIAWLEDLLVRRAQQVAAGTWPEAPAIEAPSAPAPETCPQNLVGDRAIPGEHHRPDPSGPCTFCQNGRTYVFNARSVNRHVKHAHDGDGRTLCPTGRQATDPMPDDQAARLPLCPGCRHTLTEENAR